MPRSRILVLEADDDLRQAIVRSLTGLGAEVQQARDAAEAIGLAAAGVPPEAILVDVSAQRPDGLRFLNKLRGEARLEHVPVITIGGGTPPPVSPATAARLARSFDVDELAQILVSLCGGEGAGGGKVPGPL